MAYLTILKAEQLPRSVQLMLRFLRQERDHTYRVWFFCCSLVPFLAEREGIRPRELYGIGEQSHIIPELHAIGRTAFTYMFRISRQQSL